LFEFPIVVKKPQGEKSIEVCLVLLDFFSLDSTLLVVLRQVVGEFLVWWDGEFVVLPQVWGEELVSRANGLERGLGEVTKGRCSTTSAGVDVFETRHLHKLLWHGSTDEASSSRRRDKPDMDRSALSVHLAGHRVRLAELVAPVSPSNGHHRQLGQNNRTTDGGGDFLGALDSESNVSGSVTDGNDGLEAGSLTGARLFLHWLDLQHFVLQRRANEMVDDFELLDGQGEVIDLLKALDLAILYQTTELGDRLPFLGLLLATSTPTSSSAASTTSAETTTKSSASLGWSCIRH